MTRPGWRRAILARGLPAAIWVAVILCAWSVPTQAATWYAAPSGSASGDGSPQNPWSLAHALGQVQGGDTLLLTDGLYYHVSAGGADMIDSVLPGELDITDNIFFARNAPHAQSFITLKRQVQAAQSLGITPRSPRYRLARNVFFNWSGKGDQAFIQLGEDGDAQPMISDALIENNLLIGNAQASMAAPFQFKGVRNVTVRANTVVGDLPCGAYGFRIGTEGDNPQVQDINVFNNIFADPTGTMGDRFINTYGDVDVSSGWNGGLGRGSGSGR